MNDYIKHICKIGQGAECCKYLASGIDGLECLKVNWSLKALLDDQWAKTQHVAQGDNCDGQENLKEAQIETNDQRQ